MRVCFFIGHRDAPASVQAQLNKTVEQLVRYHDVSQCIVGYHGEFDRMATIAVQTAKQKYPELYAYRLTPYFPEEHTASIPAFFDDLYYPMGLEEVPHRFAIKKANRIALDESDYLVAYVRRSGGNAAELLRHARRMEKKGWLKIINLGEPQPSGNGAT